MRLERLPLSNMGSMICLAISVIDRCLRGTSDSRSSLVDRGDSEVVREPPELESC
jgi:hypothetical protein